MPQFSDKKQESKFQEIFEKVNQIDYSAIGRPCLVFNEEDLRAVFLAGIEFEGDIIRQDFGTYLQQRDRRQKNE